MEKKIVYTTTSYGCDGRDKKSVKFASFSEKERDAFYENDPNRNYTVKEEEIVAIETTTKAARRKLNGIDKLLLDVQEFSISDTRCLSRRQKGADNERSDD